MGAAPGKEELPPQNLVTKNEVKEAKGKLQCLEKLCDHERANVEGIEYYIDELFDDLSNIVGSENDPFIPMKRKKLDRSYHRMSHFENLVISVILGGESVETAAAKLPQKKRKSK